jgi:tetratricopeptide (TPR) repeat protein
MLMLATLLCLAAGCESDTARIKDELDAGQVALGGLRYDTAVSHADAAIKIAPTAQGYYLRARAEEDRPKPNTDIAAADLAKARADYQSALDLRPGQPIKALCQAGLANVCFGLEDYSTAIFEWDSALDDLQEDQWKAYALYKVGESQQRLGRFDDADKTFARLIQQYPDQDVSTKAQARTGVRGFYVQIGSFTKTDDAQAAIKAASDAGLSCREINDQGLFAVRGGPYMTYAEAEKAKATVANQFPDAIIGP